MMGALTTAALLATSIGAQAYGAVQQKKAAKKADKLLKGIEDSPRVDPEAAAQSGDMAADNLRRRERSKYGRSKTILTGPGGPNLAPVQGKTLLGR